MITRVFSEYLGIEGRWLKFVNTFFADRNLVYEKDINAIFPIFVIFDNIHEKVNIDIVFHIVYNFFVHVGCYCVIYDIDIILLSTTYIHCVLQRETIKMQITRESCLLMFNTSVFAGYL